MQPTLSEIHRYPIKSIAADSLQSAVVEARGLRGDRRWMVVDAGGRVLTGRELGALTQISAHIDGDGDALTLAAPGRNMLSTQADIGRPRVHVTVWKNEVEAVPANPAADAWISDYLGQPARLVFMDEDARRPVDPDHSCPGDEVSFADGYPLLLISQAALDALNARLTKPVSMQRFRPNLVVAGTRPHAEDEWRRVRIGAVEFDVVKPCVRCVFTIVDPDSGRRDPNGEPLRTLVGYRRTPSGVTFGQNLIPRGVGSIRIGDAVTVLA